MPKAPGFETIEVDSAVPTWGWKFPSENKEFFVEPSQHFFREFETNYNYTGSLCWFPLLSHNWWWNHWGVRRRKYFCLQNLSPLLSQEVILSNISPDHFSPLFSAQLSQSATKKLTLTSWIFQWQQYWVCWLIQNETLRSQNCWLSWENTTSESFFLLFSWTIY